MYMSSESLLIILVVGLVAGWLAGQIMQGTGFGLIGDLIIGVAGAFVGGWLLPQLGIHLGSGTDLRNHRCHHRRLDSVADHEIGSGRKRMAGKTGKGLEEALVTERAARPRLVWQLARPNGVRS